MPTGIMPYKQGVLVTDAPDVLYLTDMDGDSRADSRETILSGFAFTNPQHSLSSPVYGPDNWIYLANEGAVQATVFAEEFGDRGSDIHFPGNPDGPKIPYQPYCVRFRPDSMELEYLASSSQFGLTFTEWGDVFMHYNSNHVRHEVIAAHYLQRNPELMVRRTLHDAFTEGNPAALHPITSNPRFEILTGIGRMTSASGLTRYLGGAFPGYEDLAVVGESAHNLVHADRWIKDESTYIARRVGEEKAFLASTDAWFRPVNFSIGPDGALYVIDYYRRVIEHPEWTSVQTYTSDTLYDGADRGRIWRITPKGGLPTHSPRLHESRNSELVPLLNSTNIWDRITAQQLLVSRHDLEVVPILEAVARNDESPLGRLHALRVLEGLGVLKESLVKEALESKTAGIRKNAIKLAEPFFRLNPARWEPVLLPLADDPDEHVRLQLVLTLGDSPSPASIRKRDNILLQSLEDEWLQTAVLTWPKINAVDLLEKLTAQAELNEAGDRFLEKIASLGFDNSSSITRMLDLITQFSGVKSIAAMLCGFRTGLENSQSQSLFTNAHLGRILALVSDVDSAVSQAALNLLKVTGLPNTVSLEQKLMKAVSVAENMEVDDQIRTQAIQLLALTRSHSYQDLYLELVNPQQPDVVQAAALEAYVALTLTGTPALLIERWQELSAKARVVAVDALIRNETGARLLVEALELGGVQSWQLLYGQRLRLVMHPDEELREKARFVLTESERGWDAILQRYRTVLASSTPDSLRGEKIYETTCRKCHQIGGQGQEVGPDLGTVQTRPAINILQEILLPNLSIAQTYESYVIELTNGGIEEGVLGSQNPSYIALRREDAEDLVIDRKRIRSMRVAQLSAMPVGFEKQITPAGMADLIHYIKTAAAN